MELTQLRPFVLTSFLLHCLLASAATLHYDFNITWVNANPDGQMNRPVIGINGQWPPPVLNFTRGDQIIARVHNALGNETTSLHWHGFYMNGTTHMDGPPSVTQCEIAPGSTFVYNFTANQTGTYWYHSHTRGQYPDGLRQALVIKDPEDPYAGKYDEERVITLSDWYHDQMPSLLKQFISVTNPTGAEPVPNSALMNDTQNLTVPVEPGKTYLFHLANVGAFASQYFWIEGHTMQIVEVDGIWTEPSEASMIYITSAQRYSVLVTMKNDTTKNYAMVGSMDTDLFDQVPSTLNYNVTGWLVYDDSAEKSPPAAVSSFDPYDDFNLVPFDREHLLGEADYTVSLDLTMDNLGNGANYAFFNGITYVMPKVPTLYSVLSTGSAASDPAIYGTNTHAFVLQKGDIIDIVLNNDDTGKHPFHLHGHAFQVISRSAENAGHYNASNHTAFPQTPMRRDTLYVLGGGHFVVRFRADNPGVWLFHCHIEWHMDSGLAATMVEAPLELQKTLVIPSNHYDVCAATGTKTSGNAAGNTEDFYDLTGANTSPAPLPAGFTARGIVALVFSCVAAVLGLISITWYGLAPISRPEVREENRHED
ncbi:iron transport multicopper oxidase FET3 precursor [Aspergillus terreus]|nr:iron transport multicopper oxidase FET3 precursor [Aspergillus terreus]